VTTTDEIDALRAALAFERTARQQAEVRASGAEAMVAHLKLLIAKMKRDRYGQSSERGQRLLDQMELQLEELEASAAEDKAASAPVDTASVVSFTRRNGCAHRLPAHLPRERVVIATPNACSCCGGKLAKLGEDITETLEVVPRQWKVIQTVRGEVHLPPLRDDHAAASAVPSDRTRTRRGEPAGDDPLRQVRRASAIEPPERQLCSRGHRARHLDPGRLGRGLTNNAAERALATSRSTARPGCSPVPIAAGSAPRPSTR